MDPLINQKLTNPDLLVITGSRLYGYAQPDSDFDYRGMISVPYSYLLGRKRFDQTESIVNGEDSTIWSLPKFFSLLEQCSPNVFELLFVPKSHILNISEIGQRLLNNKQVFISKKAIYPILGFATSEWNKVLHPERGEKGPKRQALIAQHGYDVKSTAHAVRLLYQGQSLLETGTVQYPLPIAPLLGEIRTGKYTLEVVTPMVTDRMKAVEELVKSSHLLPEKPDQKALDELFYDLVDDEVLAFKDRTHVD